MTRLSGCLSKGWFVTRPMPRMAFVGTFGCRPGGRLTFVCVQESKQRNRPCETAPAGFPTRLDAQGRAELTSLRTVQTSGAESELQACRARDLSFCVSRRFRKREPGAAEKPPAKPASRSPGLISFTPFSPAEQCKALRPGAKRASSADFAQGSGQGVVARVQPRAGRSGGAWGSFVVGQTVTRPPGQKPKVSPKANPGRGRGTQPFQRTSNPHARRSKST
jgi:hypothetical protein